MRTQRTLKIIYWGLVSQVIILLIGFITRKIFLMILDSTYLGINSLFGNIISIISLAELGVSSAIIYHLYKPIADNNSKEITKLMNLYKKVYRIIALVITIIGLLFIPFLEYVVKDSTFSLGYLRIIFCIFLFDTVVSYFFSYKRSMIFADQKNYIVIINDTIFKILTAIVNIVILILTKDFILYLLSSTVLKVLNNITIALIADMKYPYIKNNDKLEKEKTKKIFKNIKDIFINKLSWTVTSATDSIIISMYFNLSIIGMIANYNLIILSIQNLVVKLLDSTQASIGDLLVKGKKEYIYMILKRLSLLAFFIASFFGLSLIFLSSPFISIWLGGQYLISNDIIIVLILNFFFLVLRTPLWQMVGVSGLFRQERNIALIGTIANLIVSIVLVKYIGLIGVFLGTLLSILIQIGLKVPLFFNNFLLMKAREYFKTLLKFIILFFIEFLIIYYVSLLINIENRYFEFIVLALICMCIPNTINYLVFRNSEEYKYLKSLAENIVKKKTKGV
ncbi:lipopolysaccharide biosynthesis protein [Peribacillus sp. NPDC006672]|uniref:lipopolysaccharide biosynthesis protein n=1 Tax=Peribacillus sp. NPDC006672 TaxID=3390606 RepID=UPI003CFE9688